MAALSFTSFLALGLSLQSALAATVTYNWDINWVSANPDGELTRPVIGINGQWPCPTLRANVGDTVIVNVMNQLGNQSTAIHWHGLYQKGSTAMDGPVGLTQCAIPPGQSQTYKFQVGTTRLLQRSFANELRSTNLAHTFITVMLVGSTPMD